MNKLLRYLLPVILLTASAWAQPQSVSAKFRDPDLPVAARVDDLIGQLTRDEKISQIAMNNAAIPRLGIPSYHWWNEGLHGVARNGIATVFPQAIGLAATWDPKLYGHIADVIATEARAKSAEATRKNGGNLDIYQGLTIWSPNINIFRDPRWGRGQETLGEDPFLTAEMSVAFVRGLQGNDPKYLKTVATLKHFAVHSGPEAPRHHFDAKASPRDLRETYLPAFEAGVRLGHATSVMSAYNAINGIPAPGNSFLLNEILRGEWGFDGAVVGDVGTVSDMFNDKGHHYVKDAPEAIAAALKAGNDLCSDGAYKGLGEALQRGLVTEADINLALRRLFKLRLRLGLFDPPERVPYSSISIADNDTPAHDQLALQAARESIVLLKNDGALPWDKKTTKRVAILGPTGDDPLALLGNYFGQPSRPVTIVKGIRAKLEPLGVKVTYHPAVSLVAGFRESGQPFAEGVLFTDASRKTPGVAGEIFDNKELQGSPRTLRQDSQVDLFWNPAQPQPGIPLQDVQARWTGVLIPKTTGEHELAITFVGAAQLYVDDVLVAGEATFPRTKHNADDPRVRSAKMNLEAGKAYRVRLEYHQRPTASVGLIQFGWRPPGSLDDALAEARAADHIVLTLGITSALEGEEMKVNAEGFTGGDRTSIMLPKVQCDLIEAVSALKKPFVVILTSGCALSFDTDKPNAIIEAWYYGQRGGDALAEVLLGETVPSGRLPVTFYRSDNDLPPFEDYAMTNRTYRYFTGQPLYAFGHGLSYTKFDYQKFSLSAATAKSGNTITAQVTVQNSGTRDADEVVQIYATALNPPVPMPLRTLVGFQRVPLKTGEAKTVALEIPVERLRRWDEKAHCYVTDPGAYRLVAGPASDQAKLEAKLTISEP